VTPQEVADAAVALAGLATEAIEPT
jgi:hypothetical protein